MTAKPVVAATDGSAGSLLAIEWAVREAALRSAPLRIISAASLPKMVLLPLQPERDAALGFVRAHRDRVLAAAAARPPRWPLACGLTPIRSRPRPRGRSPAAGRAR
jgi:nucleotide-binding universal stress UspA family protein